jgi:hypothetical protein
MGGKLLSPFWGGAVRRSVFNLVAKVVVLAGALFGNAAFFASGVRAQALPPPFEYVTQVVCADEKIAIELLTVYEKDVDLGDKLLVRLATRGLCQRATFSGRPVADVSPRQIPHLAGKSREGHVFDVEITGGNVIDGRVRMFMLLFVLHDNKA